MGDFEFVVSDGPGRGQVLGFPGHHFYVGSGEDCHLRFEPSLVQPRHAEIVLDARGQPWVRDLTGSGLVWVNGEAVEKSQLPAGCFLRLGRLELVVRQRGRSGPSGTVATPTPLRTGAQAAARTSGVGQATPARSSGAGQQSPVRASSVVQQAAASTSGSRRGVPSEAGFDATAKRPTPFRQPGVDPLAGYVPDDGLEAPTESTVRSSVLPPGTVIDGRYHVVAKLAAGGMGEVYRAEHVELGKPMAVKVMLPELSRDPEFVARFKREAIAASRIGQQNIVDISDFGRTADGRFYFVMEYLDGLTLASLVHREGALAPERAVSISLQIARALAAAHAQSIVHRDLKPENVMLLQRPGQPDFVKVLDFGVAKVSHGQGQGGHTAVGMVVGTPQYMSPEQAKAIPVDARSDIYSLGLIVYELVTGRPTFTAETPSMLMVKHVTEAPPPFHPGPLADVPQELEALVFRMLEKDPAARPQTMDEVVQVLEGLWARLRANDPSLKRSSANFAPPTTESRANASGVAVRVSGGHASVVSSSAGQLPGGPTDLAPPRRSRAPFVVGGVLVVAIGGGAFVALKPEPRVEPPPPAVVAPPRVDPPADRPRQDAPPVVEKVTLTLQSVPDKAEVYEGDVLVGTTPFTLERPLNDQLELTFSAKGHKPLTRKFGFVSAQTLTVELEKEKKAGGSPKKGPSGLADDPYKQEEDLKDNPF